MYCFATDPLLLKLNKILKGLTYLATKTLFVVFGATVVAAVFTRGSQSTEQLPRSPRDPFVTPRTQIALDRLPGPSFKPREISSGLFFAPLVSPDHIWVILCESSAPGPCDKH